MYNITMILFSDFDGTLYFKKDIEKTCTNFDAIQKWRANGHQFCITTGRSYKSVSNEFPRIREICDYYIVDSGSIILSKSGDILKAFYFEPKVVSEIIGFSRSLPVRAIPFYYTPDSENTKHKVKNITKLRLWFEDLSSVSGIKEQLTKRFPVFAFEQDAVSRYKELNGQKGFIEIIPIECGKSHAIKALLKDNIISNENIITIGDGLNDYDMVKDFNGFAIKDSILSSIKRMDTIASVSSLINKLLS